MSRFAISFNTAMKRDVRVPVVLALALLLPAAVALRGSDWPEWRGAARTGTSTETGLPTSWSPSGENLAWKAAYGGRSSPVVFGDRLYLQNPVGTGATEPERLLCLNCGTGKPPLAPPLH